jgi:hypothetical protein
MDIIILKSWCIWMARNDFIFKALQPTLLAVKVRFKKEFALVILRAKNRLKQHMQSWIDLYVQLF